MAKSVLLVDDDPDVLDSLKTVLELELDDVEVRTAPSGSDGLALLSKKEDVGLIISDFRMPGMDGAEFLSRARVMFPHVPCVLISAFPEAVVQEQVQKRVRIDRILPKPMDMDEFIGMTKSFLGAA